MASETKNKLTIKTVGDLLKELSKHPEDMLIGGYSHAGECDFEFDGITVTEMSNADDCRGY